MASDAEKLLTSEKSALLGTVEICKEGGNHPRGWYICSPCGHFYLDRDGEMHDGIFDEKSSFWDTEEDAKQFYKEWRASNHFRLGPLLGEWRHSEGVICCGTLRIATESFDTDPTVDFKNEILDWVCRTLNKAQS